MPKKITVTDDEETVFNPEVSATKMPTNISNGRKARTDYIDMPIFQLIPYTKKENSDFSRMKGDDFKSMVDSIKAEGILDALIVRHVYDDKFEILAGETRWEAAKAAGVSVVPCRVLKDCDDNRAGKIFAITNLARRDLTVRDKINGWWHYWENTKKQVGRPSDLKKDLEAVESLSSGDHIDGGITLRQVQKYHKIHGLPEYWLRKLDGKEITLQVAYNLSFLTDDQLTELARGGYPVTASTSEELKELSQSGTWSSEALKSLFYIPTSTKEVNDTRTYTTRAVRHFKRTVLSKINPASMKRANDIVDEAMDLYFEKHPEDRLTADPKE